MDLRLHHVNVVSDNIEELHSFYSDVLGLAKMPMPPMIDHVGHDEDPDTEDDDSWRENVGFFDAGDGAPLPLHPARPPANNGPQMGPTQNPQQTGHFAFRTHDLDAVRKELTEKNIPFSDYGEWAVKDWDQIFLTDPAGNVIEIHQLLR